MTSITHRFRKAVAAFAVGTLSLAGVAGATLVANAAEGNIDTTKQGSITVHKYLNPTTGTGSLAAAEGVAGTALANVKFTVTPVTGVDLTQQSGWDALANLNAATAPVDTAAAKEIITKADGSATASGLTVGVYKVEETDTSGATDKDGKAVTVTTKAPTFLVSVPTNDNGTWVYDVNVYPKNTALTDENKPVKTVDGTTKAYFPGDTITWKITQKLPDPGKDDVGNAKSFSAYKIVDQLPAGVNTVKTENVTVEKTGDVAAASVSVAADTNTVTVEYTGEALKALKAEDTVTVTISAVVNETAETLSNQAQVTVDNETVPTTADPTDPDNPATDQTFANLTINKVNSKAQALSDATFTITPVADAAGKAIPDVTDKNVKTVITGDAGNATQKVATGFYKVTETVAPLGYEIAADYADGEIIEVTADGKTITVENLSSDESGTGLLPNLPLTGAQGAVLLTIIGAAIIVFAVGTGIVAARKNRNN